jgi:chloramphenicol-sensitive protein RarD
MRYNKQGIFFAVLAHTLWGLFPLYWPLLKKANAFEIVSHRAVWSLVLCLIVLAYKKRLIETLKLLKEKRIATRLTLSAMLISINWIVYIWSVNHGHVVEAALGYYINPLVLIAFGTIFLKEKMTKIQLFAVGVACVGVLVLTIDYGRLPWIALTLAGSWGSYGFVKKKLGLESLVGLALETLIAFPFYFGYIIFLESKGSGHFTTSFSLMFLLMGAGVVTAVPLLLFNGAVTRVPYSLLGLFQYVTPTLTFMIGVWINHEAMSTARWIGFFIIWIALIAIGIDLTRSGRAANNSLAEAD